MTDQAFSMTEPSGKCAFCFLPATEGDHGLRLKPYQVRPCPICGSDLLRVCERVNGSRLLRCAGGHVVEGSALEWF